MLQTGADQGVAGSVRKCGFELKTGTPGAIRTRDLLLRRQTLYPTELRVPMTYWCLIYSGRDAKSRRGGEKLATSATTERTTGKARQKPKTPCFTRFAKPFGCMPGFAREESEGVHLGARPSERRARRGRRLMAKQKKWRRGPESNRSERFCRPLPNLLATTPRKIDAVF